MAKQQLILGLILGGCLAAVACSSDGDDNANSTGGTGAASGGGGTHAGGSPSAGTHSGGNAGAQAGGSAGAAEAGAPAGGSGTGAAAGASEGGEGGAPTTSEAGAGGEAGAPVVVVPPPPLPPLDPYTVVVTSAVPTTFTHLLVTGLDYAAMKGEVASLKLDPAAVEDQTVYTDDFADILAVGSGGLGFVLQRSEDKVTLLDGSKVRTTFDVTNAGTNASADIAHKAYVPLYNKSLISVLDLSAGTVARRIDLSEFDDPTDSDGSVNTTAAMYDSVKQVAYFVLARIDLGTFDANNNLPCNATRALVVGVDATTDTIVDLNGAADGKAIELSLASPGTGQISADGKTITVLSGGCFIGSSRRSQGVELVHLDTHSSTIAYAPTDDGYLADLIQLGGEQALLHTFLSAKPYEAWNKLDLAAGTLGATLSNVPSGPIFDGTNVLGVLIDPISQAASVVRYNPVTDTNATIIASPWVGKHGAAAASALVP